MDKERAHQCRVCLIKKGTMFNIFRKEDTPMISSKIMCLAKVRIFPDDGLPALICSLCKTKLNACIEFIQLCEASDMRLRTLHLNDDERNNSESEHYDMGSDDDITHSLKAESTEDPEISGSINKESRHVNIFVKDITGQGNIKNMNKERQYNFKRKEIKTKQQCNICGRVMSSRHRLKTHLVTHTGDRPHSCPFCEKNFSLEANLKVHVRVHTGEKPYQCANCGETFAHSSGLIAHKRKHTGQLPYKCMLCPRSFRTIGHLQYHTKRHTGEKKFECEKCGRAFITRSDLNQHRITHSGDRAHVCSVCGLRLSRASNLKRHLQQLHSGVANKGEGIKSADLVRESNVENNKFS